MTLSSALSVISGAVLLQPILWLLRAIAGVFAPLIFIVRCAYRLTLLSVVFPFGIFSQFETVYIYCGSAAILGFFIGTCLSFTSSALSDILGLNEEPKADEIPCGLSPISQTDSRRSSTDKQPQQQSEFQSRQHTGTGPRPPFPAPSTSRITTILEEEEEDSPFLHIHRRKNKRRGGAGRRLQALLPMEISSESGTEHSDSDF